ncbi:unnamed protein product, partial [Vitis vinifera]
MGSDCMMILEHHPPPSRIIPQNKHSKNAIRFYLLFFPIFYKTEDVKSRRFRRVSFLVNITINQGKRIAGELLHVRSPVAHLRFQGAVRHVFESIGARLLVGKRGAHPRLHVSHLKHKRFTGLHLLHLLQLLERAANLVDGVVEGGRRFVGCSWHRRRGRCNRVLDTKLRCSLYG